MNITQEHMDQARRQTSVTTSMQTLMPEVIPPVYKMKSKSGRMIACSSLRPGVRIKGRATWEIIQNSAKLQNIEVKSFMFGSIVNHYSAYADLDYWTVLPPSLWYRLRRWLSRK